MDLSFALLLVTASGAGRGEGGDGSRADAYASIDVALAVETEDALLRGAEEARQRAVERVRTTPASYAPPVLHAVAHVLLTRGDLEGAAFWSHAAELRARFDARRCADPSAAAAVPELGRDDRARIQAHDREDLARLEVLVAHVIAWDRRTPHAYDPRWINVFGVLSLLSAHPRSARRGPVALSVPTRLWDALAEETRGAYLAEVKAGLQRGAPPEASTP
jgi:hypothetical protein